MNDDQDIVFVQNDRLMKNPYIDQEMRRASTLYNINNTYMYYSSLV